MQTACDLQPKVVSLPDTVGDFISQRYPALLADPSVYPEIYNSAVTDYGVYAAPELYGRATDDDFVMYASVDDYIVPPQENLVVAGLSNADASVPDAGDDVSEKHPDEQLSAPSTDYLLVPMYGGPIVENNTKQIVVKPGDTLYKLAKEYNSSVEDLAKLNKLSQPYRLAVGQKLQVAGEVVPVKVAEQDVLKIAKPMTGVQTATRVQLTEITVAPGDTLYSLSRKYSVPVNDLAVLNKLSVPFNLVPGQKLKVPDLAQAPVAKVQVAEKVEAVKSVDKRQQYGSEKSQKSSVQTDSKVVKQGTAQSQMNGKKVVVVQTQKKISSDPTKKLPKINARSSSKFSWPVRGKVLSNYGAKTNGLFNDGINIAATRGTTVKAAENGVVAYAGNEVKGMGNLIIIQHDGGWMTVYAHMDSLAVKRGVKVNVGQKIGTVGETGKVDSPQLHFEIRKGTKAYNPTQYLKSK
ncbi:MAG: LysM peptidoglycan-binding domain-containing protein [Alphaproteobacteria bacterium]|nr:LysM peptidoglycan-binding domain-containing protein [Alphaproteobacteria bacterium]